MTIHNKKTDHHKGAKETQKEPEEQPLSIVGRILAIVYCRVPERRDTWHDIARQ